MGLFLKLQLCCGLRPGEAAVIKWSDIDMANGIINVNKALKKTTPLVILKAVPESERFQYHHL